MAYRHVIAWTRILDDAKYETLDEGKVLDYMGNLFGYTQTVFETNKHVNLSSLFKCDNCAAKTQKTHSPTVKRKLKSIQFGIKAFLFQLVRRNLLQISYTI